VSLLPSLPILCPLIAAVMVLFYWHKPFVQKWITLIAMLIIIVINIVLIHQVFHQSFVVTQIGLWPAPFGITLVADMLSSMMTLTTSIIAFCVSIYSFVDIGKSRSKRGFYPAFCVLIAGLSGAFLTGDIFNLYVWFEVVLISSFVLFIKSNFSIILI